jgi:hypothetical protein
MHLAPNPGDIIPLQTGDAIILEVHDYHGHVRVLASRSHTVHPFAVWHWDNGALYSGRYFKTLNEAETYWETT